MVLLCETSNKNNRKETPKRDSTTSIFAINGGNMVTNWFYSFLKSRILAAVDHNGMALVHYAGKLTFVSSNLNSRLYVPNQETFFR